MLRELQVTMDKPANTMYKSGEDLVITGMGVVKVDTATSKTFEFPEAEKATDIFFVDAERIPTGINAAKENMSDYDEDFTNLANGEFAKLIAYYPGERFATDQHAFTSSTEIDKRVSVGTDGKLMIATVASKYIFKGLLDDNGHSLAIVEVSDTAATN